MNKFNKNSLMELLSNYIITNVIDKNTLHYSNVKEFIYNDNTAKDFINKKRNPIIYIDYILKYDKSLKYILSKYNIVLNKNMQYCISDVIKEKTNKIKECIYNKDELDNIFCPYMALILSQKQKNRVSFKNNKTNERIINYELQNNKHLIELQNLINKIIENSVVEVKKNTYIISTNNIKSYLKINDNSIDLVLQPDLLQVAKKVKKLYPFNYFIYFYIIIFAYILNQKNRVSDSKYIIIKLLDIIINQIHNKYFMDSRDRSLIVNNLYDLFFKDKIQEVIYTDYKFISDFYTIYNNSNNKNFVNFIVGQYKLYIYLKNKYNREVKNIALELYENNKRNTINKIIDLSDSTTYSSRVLNHDIISTEDVIRV